ncbi:AAA family ATPase [Fusobacterium sp. PH5-44]|uniref:AAA family ATPase n=1 Tax=unclassified Fusobacterium TaxID=2648384 RepID=UPI003D1D2E0E
MRVNRVHLENYRVHENIEIEFAKGINLLLGSNGKGKSSILEAIGYALFDSDMRRKNQKEAIRIGANKAKIEIEFTGIDEIDYVVEKLIPGGTKFYKKGSEPDPSITDKNRIETIKGLCGVKGDLKGIYDNVIIAKQNEFINAFKETDAKREEIFNKIFNTEIYKKIFDGYGKIAYDNYKKTLEIEEARLKEKESSIEDPKVIKEQLVELTKEQKLIINNLKEKSDNKKRLDEEIENYNKIFNMIEKENLNMQAQENYIESKKKEKERVEKRLLESQKAEKLLNETYESHEKYLKLSGEINKERLLLENDNNQREEYNKIEANINKIQSKKEELAVLIEEIKDEENENYQEQLDSFEKLEKEKEFIKANIEKYNGLIEDNRNSLEKLREYTCPYLHEPCKNIENKDISQLFNEKEINYKLAQDKLKSDLEDIELQLKDKKNINKKLILLKNKIELSKNDSEKIEKGILIIEKDILKLSDSEIYKKLGDIHEIIETFIHNKVQLEEYVREKTVKIKEMENIRESLAKEYLIYIENLKKSKEIEALKSEIETIQKEIKEKILLVSKSRENLIILDKKLKEIKIQELKEKMVHLNNVIQELNVTKGQLDANIKNMTIKIKEIENNIELIKEKKRIINILEKKLEMTGFFREKVKGMGKEMTKNILEEIEREATENFRQITGTGDIINWSNEDADKYLVKLKRLDGEIRFDQLSGGEQVAVAISIRGAMSSIFTESKFSIFDEPTNNLDQERRKSLAESIGEILKNLDQSIIVTHDDTFREMAEKVIEL